MILKKAIGLVTYNGLPIGWLGIDSLGLGINMGSLFINCGAALLTNSVVGLQKQGGANKSDVYVNHPDASKGMSVLKNSPEAIFTISKEEPEEPSGILWALIL